MLKTPFFIRHTKQKNLKEQMSPLAHKKTPNNLRKTIRSESMAKSLAPTRWWTNAANV